MRTETKTWYGPDDYAALDNMSNIDPFNALLYIAKNHQRIDEYTEQMLEQRRQIENYRPHRVVIKNLEKLYISSEKQALAPSCPHCGKIFLLEDLLKVRWYNKELMEKSEHGGNDETTD